MDNKKNEVLLMFSKIFLIIGIMFGIISFLMISIILSYSHAYDFYVVPGVEILKIIMGISLILIMLCYLISNHLNVLNYDIKVTKTKRYNIFLLRQSKKYRNLYFQRIVMLTSIIIVLSFIIINTILFESIKYNQTLFYENIYYYIYVFIAIFYSIDLSNKIYSERNRINRANRSVK